MAAKNPSCKICGDGDEDAEHFISICPGLSVDPIHSAPPHVRCQLPCLSLDYSCNKFCNLIGQHWDYKLLRTPT